MAIIVLLFHMLGRLAGIPGQRFTAFMDDVEDVFTLDPLLSDDDLPFV